MAITGQRILATIFALGITFGFFGISFALAQSDDPGGLVPCTNNCDFGDLLELINRLIEFLMILAVFAATLMFAWAGFILLTSGGNPSAKTRAKNMFWTAVIGLIIMGSAWLIIRVIVETLGADEAGQFLGN